MKSLEYSGVGLSEIENENESPVGARPRRRLPYVFCRPRTIAWLVALGLFLACFIIIAGRHKTNHDGSVGGSNVGEDDPPQRTPDSKRPATTATATPTPVPTNQHQPAPAIKTDCDAYFHCKTDRLGHNSRLYSRRNRGGRTGEAICNDNYMFGFNMTKTRDGGGGRASSTTTYFQWRDCSTNQTQIFYQNGSTGSSSHYYFVMLPDASWNIYDNTTNELLWKEECSSPVVFYPQCLSRPLLDCPYLHLHKSGDVVLNWINKNGKWMDQNAKSKRVYKNLFH